MPWDPSPSDLNSLKTDIVGRWNIKPTHPDVNEAIEHLKKAKNKKQAEAAVRSVPQFTDLKKLADIDYRGVTGNSKESIEEALRNYDTSLDIIKDNTTINSLLNESLLKTIGNPNRLLFNSHRGGEHFIVNAWPLKHDSRKVAVRYNNAEGKLPAEGNGHYVEWYPKINGDNSINKRFITRRHSTKLWYTVGGTHTKKTVTNGEWWEQSAPNGDWLKI